MFKYLIIIIAFLFSVVCKPIFFSPLLAEEKILSCNPLKSPRLPSSYYKMKTSYFMFKSYYLRVGEKWMPFCKGTGTAVNWSSKDSQDYQTPLAFVKGDNAVSCEFHRGNSLLEEKVKIDFDTNTSTYCWKPEPKNTFEINFNRTAPFDCTTYYKNLKCEVIE